MERTSESNGDQPQKTQETQKDAERCPRCGSLECGRFSDTTAFGKDKRGMVARQGPESGRCVFDCGAERYWREGARDRWRHPVSCELRAERRKVAVLKEAVGAARGVLEEIGRMATASQGKGKGVGTAACARIGAEATRGRAVLVAGDVVEAMR